MKGTLVALLACMIFSLDPVISKKLLVSLDPMVLAALRAALTAIILFVGMEVFHKIRELTDLSKHDYMMLGLVGFFGGTLGPYFILKGLSTTSVTNTTLISRANPLLITLMAIIFLKEKITWRQLGGAIFMLSGILFIVFRGFSIGYTPYRGDVFILLAATSWAAANIIMKKHLQKIPPEVIVAFRNIVGGIVLTALSFNQIATTTITTQIGLLLFTLAFVAVAIPQLLWYKALEMTSACNVGLTALTVPLFASMYAVILLGETIETYQLIGGTLIIAGMVLLELHAANLLVHELEHRLKSHHLFHH